MSDAIIQIRIPAATKGRWIRASRAAGMRLTDWIEEKVEAAMPIAYIWCAKQTEPGLHGVRYTATSTLQTPHALQPVQAHHDLVYDESLYEDWRLIGAAKGSCYTNDYGSFIELDAPERDSAPIAVEEVVRLGWYSRCEADASQPTER